MWVEGCDEETAEMKLEGNRKLGSGGPYRPLEEPWTLFNP